MADERTKKFAANVGRLENAANSLSQSTNNRDNITDAFDNLDDLKTTVKGKLNANAGNFGSASLIGKAAKNIFEFPVFVSSSVPVDFATATNSLLEQMYASYLQMAISINPVITERDVRKGQVFEGLRTNTTKYLEYTDMFYAHDACHNVICTDDYVFEFDMITLSDRDNKIILEALDYSPLAEFDHFFQEAVDDKKRAKHTSKDVKSGTTNLGNGMVQPNDSTTSHTPSDADIEAAEAAERRAEAREKREAAKDKRDRAQERRDEAREKREKDADERSKIRDLRDKEKHAWDREAEKRAHERHQWDKNAEERAQKREQRDADRDTRDWEKHDWDREKNERDAERLEIERRKSIFDQNKSNVDTKVKASQILDETKIQKLNTMKPLMMSVHLKVISDHTGVVSRPVEYVVGVKTHCRLVKADILPDVVEYPVKEMDRLTRKAKWRAGEIKFMDYLFSRSDKKQAAYDSRDPNRKWYHRLYNLAHMKGSSSIARKITGKRSPDGLIPNATIIMSKSDVDMIEAEKGIDLMKGSTAKKFCNELFLMSLIVIDTDAQSIKIMLPDINNDYEVHSLASVNKQLATLDTSGTVSREVSKLMRGQ